MQRVLRIGLVATTLVFLPAIAVERARYDRFCLPKELALEATAFACALALALGARRPMWRRGDLLLAGYLATASLAALHAFNPGAALRPLASSCAAFAVFVCARSLASRQERAHLLSTSSLAVAIAALVALLEACRVVPELSLAGRGPGGCEGNRNLLAHLLVIGVPAALWRTLVGGDRCARVAGEIVVALATAALVLSRCRAAWVTLAVVALVYALARRLAPVPPPRRWLGAAGAVAIGVACALAVPARGGGASYRDALAGLAGGTGTAYGRAVQYGQTLRMVAAHPWLGVGGGNWALRYPDFALPNDPSLAPTSTQPANRLPSSDWLAVASEHGLVAFALVVCAALALAVRWLRPATTEDREASLVGLLTLGAVATVSLFDAVVTRPTPAFLAALTLGALAPPPTATLALAPAARRALVVAAATVAALLVGHTARLTAAEALMAHDPLDNLQWATTLDPGNQRWRLFAAETAWMDGDCATARREAEAALAAYPKLARADRVLRACAETHAP